MLSNPLQALEPDHLRRLRWFEDHSGDEVGFPAPLGSGLHLAGKAKGIYKPKGLDHALSIRLNKLGPYEDGGFRGRADGGWTLEYAQEGDPSKPPSETFTNRGLMKCMEDQIPVGVLEQIETKPRSRYLVRGLALPTNWHHGVFTFESTPAGTLTKLDSESREFTEAGEGLERSGQPTVTSDVDARKRLLQSIAQRQGQPRFRAELLEAYGGRCAVTGCAIVEVLEAAHLRPFMGEHTNVVTNGLPLRADVHTLFDLRLIAIDPVTRVVIASTALRSDDYLDFIETPLKDPLRAVDRPDRSILEWLWCEFQEVESQRSPPSI